MTEHKELIKRLQKCLEPSGRKRGICFIPTELLNEAISAPSSGVREGMLRAAEICRKYASCVSRGEFAGEALADEITRAADHVNAAGQS